MKWKKQQQQKNLKLSVNYKEDCQMGFIKGFHWFTVYDDSYVN